MKSCFILSAAFRVFMLVSKARDEVLKSLERNCDFMLPPTRSKQILTLLLVLSAIFTVACYKLRFDQLATHLKSHTRSVRSVAGLSWALY